MQPSKGGCNLRANLGPACVECNHSKGSQNWLTWYQQQTFYNTVVEELIKEWTSNKYYDFEDDEPRFNSRAALCTDTSEIRSGTDEPPGIGENCATAA